MSREAESNENRELSGDESGEDAPAADEETQELVIVEPDAYDVDLSHGKIAKIENLEALTRVETLCFRWNLIKKIENLSGLTTLTELDLYDNQLSVIENLEALVNLTSLDLSHNRIRKIQGLETLVNLQKLHLADCNIGQIDPSAFRGLTNLVELNLSGNLLTAVPTATFSGM